MKIHDVLQRFALEGESEALRLAALDCLDACADADVPDESPALRMVLTHVDEKTDAYDRGVAEWQEYGSASKDVPPDGMVRGMHVYDMRAQLGMPPSARQASMEREAEERAHDDGPMSL